MTEFNTIKNIFDQKCSICLNSLKIKLNFFIPSESEMNSNSIHSFIDFYQIDNHYVGQYKNSIFKIDDELILESININKITSAFFHLHCQDCSFYKIIHSSFFKFKFPMFIFVEKFQHVSFDKIEVYRHRDNDGKYTTFITLNDKVSKFDFDLKFDKNIYHRAKTLLMFQ